MAIKPLFSLTPTQPNTITYNPENPNLPSVFASVWTYGGITRDSTDLVSQYDQDEIVIGADPVSVTDTKIGDLHNDVKRRCAIHLSILHYFVSSDRQYLLIFGLRNHGQEVSAQFFVGNEWVSTEEIKSDEQVAILLDVPFDIVSNVDIFVRLASPDRWAMMGFHGVDCYLI